MRHIVVRIGWFKEKLLGVSYLFRGKTFRFRPNVNALTCFNRCKNNATLCFLKMTTPFPVSLEKSIKMSLSTSNGSVVLVGKGPIRT